MKKKVLIGVSGIFVIILGICICFYISKDNSDNEMYTSNIEDKKENSVGGFLTFMLETEAGSGTYEKSTSSTWPGEGYVFNGNLSSCENGGELSWNEELGAVNLKTNNTEKCYVYFDKEPDIVYLADYIINNVYVEDGVNGLYYHDGQGTYTNVDQEAGDNSYRYAGANPNNYVCFGSDENPCPVDNLYRMIGVFDGEIKLIKNASIGDSSWDSDIVDFDNVSSVSNNIKKNDIVQLSGILAAPSPGNSGSNDWEKSDLNYELNNVFLSNFENNWQNIILSKWWSIGGIITYDAYLLSTLSTYNEEVGMYSQDIKYNAKIGLMYVSDYGYSTLPEYWTNCSLNNNSSWLFLEIPEWTITRYLSDNKRVFYANGPGILGQVGDALAGMSVRPVFYLNSDVAYASGDGSIDNPYRIIV